MTFPVRYPWIGPVLVAVLIGIPLPGAGQAPDPALTGPAAWAAILGNTITGTTADGPYAEFFTADGKAVHFDGEGREAGSWSLGDQGLCLSFPMDPDERRECRGIEVSGPHGAFVDTDGARYPFEILPGNPKGL